MRYFESFVLFVLAAASFSFGVFELKYADAAHLPAWLAGTSIALFFGVGTLLALVALEHLFNIKRR